MQRFFIILNKQTLINKSFVSKFIVQTNKYTNTVINKINYLNFSKHIYFMSTSPQKEDIQKQENGSQQIQQDVLLGKRSAPKDAITENQVKENLVNDDGDVAIGDQDNAEAENEENDDENGSEKSDGEDIFAKDDVELEWVCLRGVERYDQERQVLKMLHRNFADEKFQFTKISKPKKKNIAFIQFTSTEERNRFIQSLKNKKFSKKQKRMKVRPAFKGDRNLNGGVAVSQLEQQNSAQHQQQQRQQQPPKQASKEDIEKELQIPLEERVCPLWKTPYEEQLEIKKKDFIEIIKNFQKRAKDSIRSDESTPIWVTREPKITDFLECDEQYRFHYRNKTEFTIGLNHLGEIKVGYNRTNFDKGIAFIDDANKNCVSSKESVILAQQLENFIKEKGLPVYDRFLHQGFWRYFVVRQSFKTKEILINIVAKGSYCSDATQFEQIKQGLIKIFQKENLPEDFEYKIASIGFQSYEAPSDSIPQDGQIEIIHGSRSYKENILGKTFDISANAFLQVHTPQCERLYKLIGSLTGELNEKTIFLDICSGIGTIGICLANSAKEVIGIEMVETACNDAKVNIQQNGITNYKVICSKVEDVINEIVGPLAGQYKIIGVVDPPRPGLHANVVKAMRTCKGLDHLVYVACNPVAVTDNLLALCLPESKRRRAPAFHLTRYYGCDLFPQTKHFEGIFYLERYPNYEEYK
ncbi:hypothetical protein ABPG72_010972 [Tetrahymena utriculariae]